MALQTRRLLRARPHQGFAIVAKPRLVGARGQRLARRRQVLQPHDAHDGPSVEPRRRLAIESVPATNKVVLVGRHVVFERGARQRVNEFVDAVAHGGAAERVEIKAPCGNRRAQRTLVERQRGSSVPCAPRPCRPRRRAATRRRGGLRRRCASSPARRRRGRSGEARPRCRRARSREQSCRAHCERRRPPERAPPPRGALPPPVPRPRTPFHDAATRRRPYPGGCGRALFAKGTAPLQLREFLERRQLRRGRPLGPVERGEELAPKIALDEKRASRLCLRRRHHRELTQRRRAPRHLRAGARVDGIVERHCRRRRHGALAAVRGAQERAA